MTRYRSNAARVLRVLLALFFAAQGIVKLTGSPSWIPRFARFGALLLLAIMLGAAATHLVHREPQA